MSFKFGDMVRNDWAGDINPHKVGMFIYYTTRKSGPYSTTRFAVFTKDGDKWEHDASNEKLVVTGNLFDDLARLREENERLKKESYANVVKLLTNGHDALTEREKQAEERGAVLMLEFIDSPLCDAWQTNDEILKQFKVWREGKK